MDRLASLIGKLNEQFAENADPSQLLITTQLIETELMRLSAPVVRATVSTRVAVVMPQAPTSLPGGYAEELTEAGNEQGVHPPTQRNGHAHTSKKEEDKSGWLFNPMTEIPTLAHQPGNKELNEVMRSPESSLNDKLKEEVLEVGQRLTDSPVRDLRKAIGINDRFVFVTELFRGDEVMYERSVKTINGFRIFAEAEYWIERELKIKLGWDDSKEYVRHFYKLVKRRFS